MPAKILLLILDGWGLSSAYRHNAIAAARPPFWQSLVERYPPAVLAAKEDAVGLPPGCLSGSEVGHMTIGAGRVVWHSVAAIDRAIASGEFYQKEELREVGTYLRASGGKLHLMGLLSTGGIHAHVNHLKALIEWANRGEIGAVALHLFLDGRDMPPASAAELLEAEITPELSDRVRIATLSGRSIAMDRTERWERTLLTWQTLTSQSGISAKRPADHLRAQYREGITDEFVQPIRFDSAAVRDNDAIVCFNFRADRMRQLVRLATGRAPRAVQAHAWLPASLRLWSLTEYDDEYADVLVLFSPERPVNTVGEWIAKQGMAQFRCAETEKYAHITYFLNGGREDSFAREERLLVPSIGLSNYASQPEMSLWEVTAMVERVLAAGRHEFVVANLANADMVGHSGDWTAAIKAVRAVDAALSRLVPAAQANGYTAAITSDHGNIECMANNGEPHTAHTYNDVPFIVANPNIRLEPRGALYQVAPTILRLMRLTPPEEMTRRTLLTGPA
ncbi:MAG: 2,3-bisphosphoglycerate-independent phosphoglycerate mutase [Candidatus Magasanikbacteria bacterium GW2011_GWA2_56_11]|uniref:2,3-bisphosphoglycerate-independent phosphoglycerate mutase n=1 Tax=Candidatus Magasanikbacteria bacterium GW2011_GWA2_56_11 TaxID=1619044 RepID=A0A0G2ANZ8_9BACT|nr:MAG: 2,3-bisphosphoglycerate-independent phosphoglycerate mutase [Candidatus Magasanikbacteria bacterium GW2011_GWA2_56_11]